MEELESLEGIEHGDEVDELTEGEDSNATINVSRGHIHIQGFYQTLQILVSTLILD